MKLKFDSKVKLILAAIVSIVSLVVFTTISDWILYSHGVPNIDYENFLGNDYNYWLLCSVLVLASGVSFLVSVGKLFRMILEGRKGVKEHGTVPV